MTQKTSLPLKLAAIAAITFAFAACSKDDEMTAGQKLDSAVAGAEEKVNEAQASVEKGIASAKEGTEAAASNVAGHAEDAAITAGVNAELAKDSTLSALKIDVDTSGGKVSLHGTAPDAESRERATRLANSVKGVTDVDNKLEVAK